jgi:MerR family transcriptional regulator, light-induced transcriptional regulator
MRHLKTSEAAALLNVSPNTLRAWEQRFGFPKPERSPGKHRLFTYGEIVALRDALQDGLSISSAISRAQEGIGADSSAMVSALLSFEGDRADSAIAAALALQSVEHTVHQVLLPALDEVARRHTTESAAWAFSAAWATEWLRRAQRLGTAAVRPLSILVGDASGGELDPDAVHIRAFELMCMRSGIKVLSLSTRGVAGVGQLATEQHPDAVVLAGGSFGDDDVARWAYAVKLGAGSPPVFVYRRGNQRASRPVGANALPVDSVAASRRLLELVDRASSEKIRRASSHDEPERGRLAVAS